MILRHIRCLYFIPFLVCRARKRSLATRRKVLDIISATERHDREPIERNVFIRGNPNSPFPTPSPSEAPTEEPESPTLSPTLSPTEESESDDSAAPSGQPVTEAPSSSPTVFLCPEQALKDFLTEELTDDGSLDDEGSYQYKALDILCTTNPRLDPGDPDDQDEIKQRYALITFYYSTNGEDWANSASWTDEQHPCGGNSNPWYGVFCDDDNNVIGLDLAENDLSGKIPTEIRALGKLEFVQLDDNEISGSIPTHVGELSNLRFLLLENNKFEGNIPSEIGKITSLSSLHLDDNMLTGTLVSELGELVNLESLQLSENPSIFGTIPTELGNLENLRSFIAHFASLTGQIPDIFDSMTNLEQIQMPGNFLEGSIPASIFSLSSLESLDLRLNKFDPANLPPDIGLLTALTYLNLSGNAISGAIPTELAFLALLEELNLDNNNLTGGIPIELALLENIEILSLAENFLGPEVPLELEALSKLQVLDLHSTFVEFPGELINGFNSLQYLDLSSTQLTGDMLPAEYTSTSLVTLDLSNNDLKVEVDIIAISELLNLENLHIAGSELEGTLDDISLLTSLKTLNLRDNVLFGTLPTSIGAISTLEDIRLGFNVLSGTIPSEIGSLSNLVNLELESNYFSGTFPSEIESIPNLQYNISGNCMS